ncbi:MAG: bifunctional tetrahydrofolate synthase/dihydrofolate synthase, partial [Ruminococcus sp.]|nr:bifunctional tetrahydrofolate synthase/dihydrofolate synthase [Ruminococcus sp.]
MNFNECMEFVNSFSKSGKPVTDLSRARELMRLVGNPEKRLDFIHVAGTNGKGSTVEYISNALIYSGYKVGQFTSPFVLHYTDRIRINGKEIDEKSFCKICEFVKERIDNQPYSQFEITMAIAMWWFDMEVCDIVVLEAGIGGLLDCTNIIQSPVLSVITSISLDHTAILGDTIEKIAVQKAGIIKENSAVVLSVDNKKSVVDVVKNKAHEKNCGFIMPSYG